MPDVPDLRRDYLRGYLDEDTVADTWLAQFRLWFHDAVADPAVHEANAMQLATVRPDGRPSVRSVLLKAVDEAGVVFYTNYDSAKGHDLASTPFAAAVFVWTPHERQIRVSGPVTRVSPEETAEYFASRPRGAQLGAWASRQSQVIGSRDELEHDVAQAMERFPDDTPVPVPPNWGGFRIAPDEVEFWQGRRDRLHDRLRFRLADGTWVRERLAP